MAQINFREALNQAMDEEMSRDDRVILMGEEVARYHGAYKVSQGLWEKYGDKRVIDTPITEGGFTGTAIGAAMAGLRPIVEWMTFNFSIQALDQVINNAAKYRYMSGGQLTCPIVFRGPNGPAEYLASQHSQALQSFFAHVPGLKVVSPSNPYDAKGLLKSAIRDDNPVVFLEAEMAYSWKGDVPQDEYLIPIGEARVKRPGSGVTLIGFGKPMRMVEEAAEKLKEQGLDPEVIDLRTIKPIDEKTIYESVKKTNRCVVVDEAWPFASVGTHLGWLISKNCFDYLDAPVEVINCEDVPMPYNHHLELAAQPSVEKIVKAARKVSYAK